MSGKLIVYRKGKKSDKQLKYGEAIYLNLSKRSFDDIQGMRFATITVCEGCTEVDKIKALKYLL